MLRWLCVGLAAAAAGAQQARVGDAVLVGADGQASVSSESQQDDGSDARQLFDRTTVAGVYDNSSGPLYPVFVEDTPLDDAVLFATATPIPHVNDAAAVPAAVPPKCNLVWQAACRPSWRSCVLQNASSYDLMCDCYFNLAKCHRIADCFDLLSRDEILYCANTMQCTLNQCEGRPPGFTSGAGSPAGGSTVAVVALTAVAAAAALLLVGAVR